MKLVKFSHAIVTCVVLAVAGVGYAEEKEKKEEGKKEEHKEQKLSAMDEAWLKMTALENMAAIRMAKAAEEKATSEKVKQHAAQVLKDHMACGAELKELAKQKDVELKHELPEAKKELLQEITSKSGQDFDQAYMNFEVAAHRMAVAHFQNGADFLKDKELQAFAQKQLPVLEQHLSAAEKELGRTTQTQPGQPHQQPGQVPPAQQQQPQPGQVQTPQ